MQDLPDVTHIWGEGQQRVSDPFIGLASCDPLEDLLLLLDRKTEVRIFIPYAFDVKGKMSLKIKKNVI